MLSLEREYTDRRRETLSTGPYLFLTHTDKPHPRAFPSSIIPSILESNRCPSSFLDCFVPILLCFLFFVLQHYEKLQFHHSL